MVRFRLDLKTTEETLNKIISRWAFLIQRELILRFPVSFRNRIVIAKEGTIWIIGSNYEILRFYDKGTKPHKISPKIKKALAFKWAKAPSIPRQPSVDGRYIFKEVLHPGTKAKNIIENLEKDKQFLQKLLDQAVKSVIK